MLTRATRRDFLAACAAFALPACTLTASFATAFSATPSFAQTDDVGSAPQSSRHHEDERRIPAPDPLVARMLQLAQLGADDALVDLGSGDGQIVIAAARDFGARAHGIEYDAKAVERSRRNAQQAGVSDRVRFEQGDLFAADLWSADVVTLHLMPELNLRLRPALLAMRPGARIVSREFRMGDWEPDESSRVGTDTVYLWVVPASADGRWTMQLPQRGSAIGATMTIRQRFQKLDGRIGLEGVETSMREARVLGDQVHFAFTDGEGTLRMVDARIEATRMIGAIATKGGEVEPFVAERVGARAGT